MRQHAEEITLSADTEEAAKALGRMGRACGNCHWFAGRGPSLAPEVVLGHPAPGAAPTLSMRMQRHRVASEQLWYGLVQPSDALWQQGAVTFTRAEIVAPVKDGDPVPDWMADPIERFRGLAHEARSEPSYDGRAERYGEILARCATCHFQVRRSSRE